MVQNSRAAVALASILLAISPGCAVELSATRESGEIRVSVKPLPAPTDQIKVAELSAQE